MFVDYIDFLDKIIYTYIRGNEISSKCVNCHLHIQQCCKNGGGVYDRIFANIDYTIIIYWNNIYNYHKYCLNYNVSYYFEQIKTNDTFALQSDVSFIINNLFMW